MQRELLGEALSSVHQDDSPQQSISRARSFSKTRDRAALWANVIEHLQYTILKMRRQDSACQGISVWLRDSEYRYESAHASLPQPADTEGMVAPYVQRCFRSIYQEGMAYTQAGLALWRLSPRGGTQFSLFTPPEAIIKEEDLQETLDEVRARFGRRAIARGSALAAPQQQRPTFGIPIVE
jgi:DNA polymerase V